MKKEYAEEVAAKIIEQLEQGTAPWQKPWKPGELSLPYNAATQKEYRGINSMWLAMQGHGDPRWMTYNQANDAGAQVRKGSKGTKIVYWKTHDEEKAKDASGRPIIGEDGKPKMIRVALERPRAFHAIVFNAEQIDGLPPLEPKAIAPEPERHARAEAILANSSATIQHVAGNRAFYQPSTDRITMPERGQFDTADGYYATALHELGHWTGHPSRMDRDLSHPFGSEGYAREELRAEISSLMVGERLEIGHDPGQHAAYVGSWIKALKEDPREIFRAAADAEKIAGYVMAFEQERVQKRDVPTPELTREQAQAAVAVATIEQGVFAGLESLGWTLTPYRDGSAIATKTFNSLDVTKDALAYLTEGDGINRTLQFEFNSEGRNVAEADSVLIPVNATSEQATALAAGAAENAEQSIRVSYGVRLATGPADEQQATSSIDVTPVPTKHGAGQALALPEGWTEATPGGMATNPDPERGGIVDTNMVSGQWFYVANREGLAASEAIYPSRAAALEGLAEALTQAPEPEQHYSDRTLQALVENHGWEATAGLDGGLSVRRQFEGVGPTGTMITPDGERNFYAGYSADPERRRYIALTLGDEQIVDFDGRDSTPSDIARLINLKAEQFADEKRVANGLEPIYAVGSPTLELSSGDPTKLHQEAFAVWQYDEARNQAAIEAKVARKAADMRNSSDPATRELQERIDRENATAARDRAQDEAGDDPEAKLRALWDSQGVPKERQDALIAEVAEKAKPGAQVGPFVVPGELTADQRNAGFMTPEEFERRHEPATAIRHHPPENPMPERTYLAVPYAEKDQAKAAAQKAGFKLQWDKENKAWFAPAGADLSSMERWKADGPRVQTPTTKSAEDQFADALKDAGLRVDGQPVMDGKIHRVPVEGDRDGELSGAYAGHLEGRIPGGYIENFKTGERINWKAEGTVAQTTPEERARLAAEAAERQQKREAQINAKHEATAAAAKALWREAPDATANNAYCKAKGITEPVGLRTVPESLPEDVAKAHNIKIAKTVREAKAMRAADPDARVFKAGDLLIPGTDMKDGKLWTLQSVNPHFKSFMKGGRKHGVATLAGIDAERFDSIEKLADENKPIIVAEGYATADSVSKLAGQPVVVAFDSGNLDAVVRDMRETFPNRALLIAADNDHEAEAKLGPDGKPRKNVGMEKAEDAAKKHGAGVIAPQFKTGEKGSDWNDRVAGKGEEEARREFDTQMALAKREAAINAERLTVLARERDQEARNDPTTSADDANVAVERGRAAELITNANEQVSNVRAAAAEGKSASRNGLPAAASIKASLDRKNADLQDETKQERQDVQNNAQTVNSNGATIATRQGVVIAEQRRIDISGNKQEKPGKPKRPRSRGIDAGM